MVDPNSASHRQPSLPRPFKFLYGRSQPAGKVKAKNRRRFKFLYGRSQLAATRNPYQQDAPFKFLYGRSQLEMPVPASLLLHAFKFLYGRSQLVALLLLQSLDIPFKFLYGRSQQARDYIVERLKAHSNSSMVDPNATLPQVQIHPRGNSNSSMVDPNPGEKRA